MASERRALARLQGFAHCQLAGLRPEEILANTAALVTACAFFRGAWEILSADCRSSDIDRVLGDCLQAWFKLPADNALGLLNAVTGLARRYRYLANAEELGRHCARTWEEGGADKAGLLAVYLRRHAHVTMADLGFAGVSGKSETVAGGAPARDRPGAAHRPRRHQVAWAALLLAAAAALGWALWHGGLVEMPW